MNAENIAAIMFLLFVVLTVAAMLGLGGYLIGRSKGRGPLGFVLGFALGIFGVALIAVLPDRRQKVRRVSKSARKWRDTMPVLWRRSAAAYPR